MTDQEHANKLDELRGQINQAIYEAAVSGLIVSIEVLEFNRIRQAAPTPSIGVTVTRPIEPVKES